MAENREKNQQLDKLTFEQSIKALTAIVTKVETGESGLEESLGQYEKGMALIRHCRELLARAEERIEKITAGDAEGGQ